MVWQRSKKPSSDHQTDQREWLLTNKTCLIPSDDFQSFFRVFTHISPFFATFGWKIVVRKKAFGGSAGKVLPRTNFKRNRPPAYGVPAVENEQNTWKYWWRAQLKWNKIMVWASSILHREDPQTWSVNGGLDFGYVFLIWEHLNAFWRLLDQIRQFFCHLPDQLRRHILHIALQNRIRDIRLKWFCALQPGSWIQWDFRLVCVFTGSRSRPWSNWVQDQNQFWIVSAPGAKVQSG